MLDISFPLILIGPTGAGKTTVGRVLAAKLNVSFFDLDDEIETRSGANIHWIFDVEGEDGFRDRETRVFADLVRQGNVVVSTGAGVVLREKNRHLLMKHKRQVIWLQVDLKTQLNRLKNDKNRPLLQVTDAEGKLRAMAAEREPFYQAHAAIQVQTSKTNPAIVVRQIIERLKGENHENA